MNTNAFPNLEHLFQTHTLMGLFTDIREPQNFWRNLGFREQMLFDTEHVTFEKVFEDRKAAPFVPPLAQGEGVYDRQSELKTFRPSYIKLEDSVTPGQFIRRQPGQLATMDMSSPQARIISAVGEILRSHRNVISNRLELMAAQVMLNAACTFEGPQYPSVTVDFKRDPSLDITLDPATEAWTNSGVNIIRDLSSWVRLMGDIEFGGTARNIIFGENAWEAFINDPQVRETLSLDIRSSVGDLRTGITDPDDVVFMGNMGVGRFGFNADFWINRQKVLVQNPTTGIIETVPLMDPDCILMVAGNYQGVEAYGMVYDIQQSAPTDVLVYSYDTQNPRHRNIVTQTAPIMVPIFPNRTLKARVVFPD
jgi:hypothetical protein